MSVGGVERSDSMDTDNSCYEDCQERFVQDSDENEDSEDDTDFIDDYNHLLEVNIKTNHSQPPTYIKSFVSKSLKSYFYLSL